MRERVGEPPSGGRKLRRAISEMDAMNPTHSQKARMCGAPGECVEHPADWNCIQDR